MTIRDTECDTYDQMWALPAYATYSPGETYVPIFLDMTQATDGTVLDAGCGSGKGALALLGAGFTPHLCDLTREGLVDAARALPFRAVCLWHDLAPQLPYVLGGAYDYVYCCDVLEHVPLPFAMLVARNLLAVSRHGVFFSITLHADIYGAFVGKTLHQSLQSFVEWRDQLAELGTVVECRDLLNAGVYLVEPR